MLEALSGCSNGRTHNLKSLVTVERGLQSDLRQRKHIVSQVKKIMLHLRHKGHGKTIAAGMPKSTLQTPASAKMQGRGAHGRFMAHRPKGRGLPREVELRIPLYIRYTSLMTSIIAL